MKLFGSQHANLLEAVLANDAQQTVTSNAQGIQEDLLGAVLANVSPHIQEVQEG